MASTKDRLDSLEKKLQTNRQLMTKQAKKAAKLEKKLKILTGGYQARAAALGKQCGDTHDQIEQGEVELKTFQRLQELEQQAIPKRLEVLQIVSTHVIGGYHWNIVEGCVESLELLALRELLWVKLIHVAL